MKKSDFFPWNRSIVPWYKKAIRMMKISVLLLFTTVFSLHAKTSLSQVKRVTIHLTDVTLSEVFDEIESQTEYDLFYNKKTINDQSIVSVNVENEIVATVLKSLFADKTLDFKLLDNSIIIVEGKEQNLTAETNLQQEKLSVTGKVKDEQGEPVPGVSVVIKGTSIGTITDIDGNFYLDVERGSTLLFSFVGMEPLEIIVEHTELNVTMRTSLINLDEIVAIGYGSMKKSDLTGAVVSANINDFKNSPNTNAVQLLQGTVPGLNIGQVTSAGSTPSISIRGKNTLSGNQDVLIVLDGIIYNSSLSSINPADIASVDVLKDASAAAVYGSHGANGVILITTKKGSEGETDISFSSSYSISTPTKDLRPMNRNEYLSFVTDFYYGEAYLGSDYNTPNPDFILADKLPDKVMRDDTQSDGISPYNYNWWDEGTHTGSIRENQLSISGGNKMATYLFSLGNTKQENYIINDDFERNSIRLNLDANPTNWWKVGIQSFGSFVNKDGAEPDLTGLRRQSPLITPYDADGNIKPYPFNTLDTNPFMGSDVDDKERQNYFFANIYSEWKLPVNGLTYRINFGNNYRIEEHDYASEYGAGLTGSAYKHHATYSDYTFDNILNYNKAYGDHDFGATFVYGAIERKYSYTDANADGFDRLALGYNSLELGTNQYANSDAWEEALLYQMLRANYKYNNKYLITATMRRDGFSGFAENNKTALFPSVALGWVLSEESFFRVPFVDYLKVRAGYGVSGNQTSRYKSLAKVTTQAGYVFGDGGSTLISQKLATLQNSDLKWEKTKGINAGMDFTLFNSRLNGSFEYYRNTTKDLLYDVAIPTITGFSTISSNVGEIRNTGIEFNITSRNISSGDFEWTTTFNISSNSNKIVTLFGTDGDGDGVEDDLVSSGLFIGEPISAIYGYKIDGIYQVGDDIPAGYNPGNYKIHDVTGEGDITTDDRVILGKSNPAYRFGIMNKFKIKDLTLSFFINSIQGGKDGYLGSNSMALYRNDNNLRWNLISDQANNLWSPNHPDAIYSRAVTSAAPVPTRYEDRSFIRLQDVNIAYNLPPSLLSSIGAKNLSVYINAKNLLTLTDWHGWDPEANSNYGGRPVMKSITIGLNVTL